MQSTSKRLEANIPKIMKAWEERALAEITAAQQQGSLALRNSLPEYLSQLVSALSTTIDRTHARKRADKEESTRVGKKHGRERAGAKNYTMDQMILEYHILREVLFDVMEEEAELTAVEREVMICSVEQAVNDAATQFSESMKDYQNHLSHTLVHDLRNPLSVVKASAQLMLRKSDISSYNALKTNLIIKNIDRIDSMIGELLDESRKSAWDDMSQDFKDCDLDLILKETIEGSSLSLGDRFIYCSEGTCIGNWNENSLRRLIENLTTNAVKYGDVDGKITFTLKQDATHSTFTIHNEGNPIPLEEQKLLFDKYRRSRNAKNQDGWGLGLTVVKTMVDAHQGNIEVVSEGSKGTTFVVTLPKTRAADLNDENKQH